MKKMVILLIVLMMVGVGFFSGCTQQTAESKGNNGDSISDNDEKEYWALCIDAFSTNYTLLIKNTLIQNGWKENNIKTIDQKDGKNITKEEFMEGISWLKEHADSNDISLIFSFSHGAPLGLCIYHSITGEAVYYDELNEELKGLDSKGIVVFIDACTVGYAIDYLKNDGRIIITGGNRTSSGCGEFFGYIAQALSGLGDLLGDNNGIVSAEEVFSYIIANSKCDPQIQDDYEGQLNLTYLNDDLKIDQKQIYHGYTVSANPSAVAQSFVPSKNTLEKIKLIMYTTIKNINESKLIVSIRDSLNGENLTSITIPAKQFIITSCRVLYEFDFDDIKVNPGETYYIVIQPVSPAWDLYQIASCQDDNSYEKGTAYTSYAPYIPWDIYKDNGSGPQHDLFFITYGQNKSNGINEIPNVNFSYYQSSITSKEEVIQFNDTSKDSDGKIISWFWDFNDGTNSTDPNPVHHYVTNGRYNITLTINDNEGAVNSITKIVEISLSPSEKTSGFELILVVCAIAIFLFWKRKRENG